MSNRILGWLGLICGLFLSCFAAWCAAFLTERSGVWWLISTVGWTIALFLVFQSAPLIFSR